MTRHERWLLAAAVFVIASLWTADARVGLLVLLLGAFAYRMSRDLA